MSGKVFVVAAGCYSDYGVVGIYSEDQEEAATIHATLIGGEVVVYPLNEPVPEDPGLDWYAVYIKKNGDTKVQAESRLNKDGDKRITRVALRTHNDYLDERKSYWQLTWFGYAKSEEHAVRSANELRRQILAGQRPEGVDMGMN